MQTDILLVRHGQSYSNLEGYFHGVPPGPGLTPRGHLQAEAACGRLLDLGLRPARIVSSPLRRALETAAPLGAALGLPAEVEPALAETGFGGWEGRSFEDLRKLPDYHAWLADPDGNPPPGGERFSEIGARVANRVRELGERHEGGTVVGFSHMHPIIVGVLTLLGRPLSEHRRIRVPNATIVHLRREPGGFRLIEIDTTPSAAGDEAGGVRAGA